MKEQKVSTFTIELTQNQKAFVDERDWYDLRKYNWHAQWNKSTNSFYARRWNLAGKNRAIEPMHRRILGLQPGDGRQVDHLNHNTLDNRRENLVVVTNRRNSENRRDQSAYGPGIWKHDDCPLRPFQASVRIDRRRIQLGFHATAEDAIKAREDFLRRFRMPGL
jgi:hypothetical protein